MNTGRSEIRTNRIPDKIRCMDAINHIEADEVPFYELEVAYELVEQVLGKKIAPTRSYLLPPADYADFLKLTGMDMAYLHVPWKLGRKEMVDERGMQVYVDGIIKDFADLGILKDPGTDQIKQRIEEMLEVIKDTKIGIIYALYNTPPIVTTAVGYQDYYVALVEKPEFIEEFQKRVDEHVQKQAEVVLSYPIDGVLLANMLCMNTGPIMSFDMMEKYEFPYLKNLIDKAKEKGKFVEYHADGDNSAIYPRLIEMGVDSIHAIESIEGRQSICELKRLYGEKLAFHGNIDVGRILVEGKTEDVVRDVIEHIRILTHGGGYIGGSSHDINEKVSFKNFRAMIETMVNTRTRRTTELDLSMSCK
jgi:hypothetical protein